MRFMVKSVRGNAQNEDSVMATRLFGFVIDGASGLYSEKVTNFSSDAQWFSHSLSKLLSHELSKMEWSIAEHVERACERLLEEYQQLLGEKGLSFAKEKLPNSTISVVRFQECTNQLELFQLGDSPILVEQNERLTLYDDELLAISDYSALSEMLRIAKKREIDLIEARPLIAEHLKANRRKRNTSKGYWILDPTGEGIKGARCVTLPLDEVTRLVIMSDGLWEAYDTFRLFSKPEELFERIFSSESLEALISELRVAQMSDPLLNHYPRFKLMDDASVLRYNFDN